MAKKLEELLGRDAAAELRERWDISDVAPPNREIAFRACLQRCGFDIWYLPILDQERIFAAVGQAEERGGAMLSLELAAVRALRDLAKGTDWEQDLK